MMIHNGKMISSGWWKKSYTSWYSKFPIICKVFFSIPGGCLGFLPSTVPLHFLSESSWRRSLRTWPSTGNSHEKNGSIHRPINWIRASRLQRRPDPLKTEEMSRSSCFWWDEIWKLTGGHCWTPPKQCIVIRDHADLYCFIPPKWGPI